eukprot:CAMPEP_0119298270 /NCGR_PEP_ID=MMETSP1333-20130426/471_1 /TAXON_ID=418940 /ORGANISM="Scyphosphaera apsteinii, Strain RCC1455" /LENGTH=372 /DNA_ID=CAMNT_0007299333 /DNA_START=51 /DNA_END=1169 /DNA_ORIENTATION=+
MDCITLIVLVLATTFGQVMRDQDMNTEVKTELEEYKKGLEDAEGSSIKTEGRRTLFWTSNHHVTPDHNMPKESTSFSGGSSLSFSETRTSPSPPPLLPSLLSLPVHKWNRGKGVRRRRNANFRVPYIYIFKTGSSNQRACVTGKDAQWEGKSIVTQCCKNGGKGKCERYDVAIGPNKNGCHSGIQPAIKQRSYPEAFEYCRSLGNYGLCDKNCKDRGCGYNFEPIWTSQSCTKPEMSPSPPPLSPPLLSPPMVNCIALPDRRMTGPLKQFSNVWTEQATMEAGLDRIVKVGSQVQLRSIVTSTCASTVLFGFAGGGGFHLLNIPTAADGTSVTVTDEVLATSTRFEVREAMPIGCNVYFSQTALCLLRAQLK